MRNLIVETQSTVAFEDGLSLPCKNYHCCYDYDKNVYYLVECDENVVHVINLANESHVVKRIVVKIDKPNPVGIEYSSNNEELYIAYDCGLVYELKEFDEKLYETSEVAEFPSGLHCMKISPDNEVAVFVSKDLTVTVITCKFFDYLNSANLMSADFGEKEFITVGWGKKETQFHGSEGKAAAKKKIAEFRKTETDDGLPKITWNTLSTLFAVSFVDVAANARKFKVFDRKGILQYTSEFVDYLEGTLAWKVNDNLIASTRKLPNKYTVSLFNKNGLLHREFTLPFNSKDYQIIELIWSRDSDVLGIWHKDLVNNVTVLQLWSQSNYHWYLKQTIKYPKKYPILFVGWYPQIDKDLLILSLKNSTTYTFYWAVSHSYGKQESDKAVVSVINGNEVYVTKFKYFLVPPPMCQQKLEFKESINAISFAPNDPENSNNNSNDFIVLLSNNKIVLCKDNDDDLHSQHIYKTYNVPLSVKNGYMYSYNLIQHLFWYRQDVILFSITLGSKSSLYELHLLHIEALDEILLDYRLVQDMPGKIQHIGPSADSKTAYVIVNNQVYRYNERDGLVKSDLTISNEKFSRAVVKMESLYFGEKQVTIALTQNHVLYADGKQVSNNVTSFFVHSDSLLITTQHHTMICFDLSPRGLDQLLTRDLTAQPWEKTGNGAEDLNVRRVERGSSIVTAVAKSDRTVVQMPRGNLETIQHRALTIAKIKPLLDSQRYKEAMLIMHKQQMDNNLFYDHDPRSFVDNVEKFVADLDARSLTSFLSELNEDDVTRGIYRNSYSERKPRPASAAVGAGKVEAVCDLLRSTMERNSKELIEPIIVSLVKREDTRGIEKALRKLQQLSQCEGDNGAEKRLQRLNFILSKRNLFDIALGTYDLKLALFVAEATGTNSRENVDFLKDFRELEVDYMRYKIDMHLKRYPSALANLAKLPARFDECVKLIKDHSLYPEALQLFGGTGREYALIANAYADVLRDKGKHREAGILYTKAEELGKALEAYKKAGSWRDAIATGFSLKLSQPESRLLHQEAADQLERDGKYEDAATVLSKYLDKTEDAVAMLCKGKKWIEAWSEASCINRPDLIESHVKPSVLDHGEFLLRQLRAHREDFGKHASRLLEVQANLLERRRALGDLVSPSAAELGDTMADDCGATSLADSVETRTSRASRSSNRTYRSSKNRRKHERKMCSIKQGSLYEDLGLVRALHQIVAQVYELRDDVRSVAEMLLYGKSDGLAWELHREMAGLLDDIGKRKHEVWPTIRDNPYYKMSADDDGSGGHDKLTWIEPRLLFPPEEKPSDWKLDMLS